MTYIEQAIERAIEGGWNGLEFHDTIKIDTYTPVGVNSRVWGESELGEGHGTTVGQILLDPEFWKYLGKAEGWGKCTMYSFSTGKVYSEDEWLYNHHCFIDHLAENKSVESFFESLLKQKN